MKYVINTKKKRDEDDENESESSRYKTKNITGSGSLEDLARQLRAAQDENGHIAGAFMMGPDGKAIPLDSSGGPETIIASIRKELSKRLGNGPHLEKAMKQVEADIRGGKMTGSMAFGLNLDRLKQMEERTKESDRVASEDVEKYGPVKYGEYNPGRRVVIHSMGITDRRATEILERLGEIVILRGDAGSSVQAIDAMEGWDFREKAYAIMNMERLREEMQDNPAIRAARLLKSIKDERMKRAKDPSYRSELLEALERNPAELEKVDKLMASGLGDIYDEAQADSLAAREAGQSISERMAGETKESIIERVRKRKAERELLDEIQRSVNEDGGKDGPKPGTTKIEGEGEE